MRKVGDEECGLAQNFPNEFKILSKTLGQSDFR
jgi:hypothetical protein